MDLKKLRSVALAELAGCSYTPKRWRQRLMSWAGARLEAAPGRGFRFSGVHANLRVGRGSYMNHRVSIEAVAPVVIGRECHLGPEVMILTSHHPIDETGSWTFGAEGREVTIGDKVWIGARAVVLPGAVIEAEVIIAAGAVVAGRCESYGVYGGVPARRLKSFSPAASPAAAV
ncbi:DapH/DapD/GlmU-related protein [Blastococcus sp. TF02A-26]|uniref:acyltransferase n=1 Tax=Blastococcus sp. TF02A-26 TaxID=2250577 RepID=UPI00131448BC|nr:acyltransferase [Blastococcus sp. TF02A-26]